MTKLTELIERQPPNIAVTVNAVIKATRSNDPSVLLIAAAKTISAQQRQIENLKYIEHARRLNLPQTEVCAAFYCAQPTSLGHSLCFKHWSGLPAENKTEIKQATSNGETTDGQYNFQYADAVGRAVRIIRDYEKR